MSARSVNVRSRWMLLAWLVAGAICLCGGPLLNDAAHAHAVPKQVRRQLSHPPAAGKEKYALLIGISKYNHGKPGDWWNLNTKADVEILANVLVDRFRFKPENITILCDEPVKVGDKVVPATQPTKQAIESAFHTALIDRVHSGDVAYFHFSGHGQRIPDDNGDETDGYDESIIPIDYVSKTDPANNIRDDDIGVMLDELDKKGPANVTITLDSCFSGTATRGDDVRRGDDWTGPPVVKPGASQTGDGNADFVAHSVKPRGAPAAVQQRYVFISATSKTQPALQTTQNGVTYGAFTYALAKAMECSGPTTTYRDLFERITSILTKIHPQQTPQIEGDERDQVVMEDGAVPRQRYVGVKTVGSETYLTAGQLQGMTKGSRFGLYPEGTHVPKEGQQIATVEITDVHSTTSPVKVIGTVDAAKLATATRAFEIQHNYDSAFRVAVRPTTDAGPAIDAIFKELGLVERVPEAGSDWKVLLRPPDETDVKAGIVSAGFKGLILQRRDGTVVRAIPDGDKMAEQAKAALKGEANWQLVKSFDDNTLPDLDIVKLTVVPVVDVRVSDTGVTATDSKTPPVESGGKTEMHACETVSVTDGTCVPNTGDYVRLQITNNGDQDVYVTVLDLRSDGVIGPAFPLDNSDNLIKAHSSFSPPTIFQMSPPFGEESFRAIVTDAETDFAPLIDESLRSSRGPAAPGVSNASSSPIGILLMDGARGTRGQPGAAPSSWGTSSVTYFIVPPVKK